MNSETLSRLKMTLTAILQFIGLLLVLSPCNGQSTDTIPVLETGSRTPMPPTWIDEDTGHRLIRLSDREGDNRSFYFHNNPFIPQQKSEGDLMVFYGSTSNGNQLFTMNLKTRKITQLTDYRGRIFGEIVDPHHRKVYFQSADTVFSTQVDNPLKENSEFIFPEDFKGGITTLNADGTTLAGVYSGEEKRKLLEKYPKKGDFFTRIFEAKLPHTLFTINLKKGELNKIHTENTWLGHVQFSPADPRLLMFCHEGPWHLVDRIWTIDIDIRQPRLMHQRSMDMEIAGHEFFGPEGDTIWFDLQMPRGKTFFLAGVDVNTGKEKKYQLTRDEWSIHFNISQDQRLFCGDGGDPSQVARAEHGMWIYLFSRSGDHLESEKLVNMENHNYELEPNVHFSPDQRWVIFRANFEGNSEIYAVEIDKEDQ